MTWRRLRLLLPVPLLAVTGIVWPLTRPDVPPRSAGEVAYHELPAKPAGDADRGKAGVETSAIALAAWLHAVPASKETPTVPCADTGLRVAWDALPGTDHLGAFIGPLGPAPGVGTLAVNGIVVCSGSDWAFMGFQARYADGKWDVIAVPDADAGEGGEEVTAPEPVAPAAPPAPTVTLDGRTFAAAIEGLAAYEPQRTCDGTAKPGTAAMRNLLLKDNPGSRNLGIVRGCSVGGQSEHKEGRAFDWGVNVSRPAEKAEADAFVAKLLATDEHGNRYALARRMGVMYVIWNQRIWSAYRADEGWRPYHGASPHTDHVHISLSWAGALGRTSFWSGNVVEVLLASSPTGGSGQSSTARATSSRKIVATPIRHDDVDRAARDAQRAAEAAQRAADREARRAAAEQAQARWRETHDVTDATAEETSTRRRMDPSSTTVPRSTTSTVPRSTSTTLPRVRSTTTTVPRTTTTTVPRTTTTTVSRSTTTVPGTTSTTTGSTRSRRGSTTTTTAPRVTTTTAPPATTTTTPAPAPSTTTTTAGT